MPNSSSTATAPPNAAYMGPPTLQGGPQKPGFRPLTLQDLPMISQQALTNGSPLPFQQNPPPQNQQLLQINSNQQIQGTSSLNMGKWS